MALGARPQQVRAQFLAIGLRLLAAGVGLGLLGAWLTGRAMQPVLFHVPALHVATLAGAVCVIAAVSLCACLLPSHRAARITPVEAMNP
jgi:ABC-type antimicrobial peptide transport system permease subunit